MGKIFDEPQFPVVDKAPSFWRTVGNFNVSDWGVVAAVTGVSIPVGYAAGAQPSPAFTRLSGNMAKPSMVAAGLMGVTLGFMLAYQNSSGRLMGFLQNDTEVKASH
ncbi:hypothetical protein N2152v2_001692 [Parachlorella kessleri]